MLEVDGEFGAITVTLHALDEGRLGAKIFGKRASVFRRDPAHALHARIGGKHGTQTRGELIERLVGECEPYAVLSRLVEDRLDVIAEVLLRLVNVDHGRGALVLSDRGALKRGLGQQRDEELPEELRALALQEVFGGGDQDDLAALK